MNILITGGTGSLGRAVIAKLLDKPSFEKICVYSRDEHKQEQIKEQFNNDPKLRFFIGDIRDKDRLRLALKGITHVIHAAALKIVPTGEYNPFETLKTNVIGAQNLIDCLLEGASGYVNYPTRVIALSTDKAVHPINLYGATKLCAEKLFMAANNVQGPHGHKFSVARYGNVSNSNGSVIPLFMRQVVEGKQLTITNDKMSRFWITLDEASDFVLKCMGAMYGGEIFVPEMPSFKIKDLAHVLMAEHNYPPEKQWCEVIGIRPGEKLYEEIITKEECGYTEYFPNEKLYIVNKNSNSRLNLDGINSDNVKLFSRSELKEKLIEIGVLQ